MTGLRKTEDTARLRASFLEEYSSDESIRKYSRKTAGDGISYLLDHEYGRIYLESIEKYALKAKLKTGIRLWEFGCGAGMNLLHLVSVLERRGIEVDFACGTDFSETLIVAARSEANTYLATQASRVRFAVARNEDLIEEGARGLGLPKDEFLGFFDLVFGVNTIRYGHRLKNVDRCIAGISGLLRAGGVCIVIDMNRKFPAFRSRLRAWPSRDAENTFLPTLDEYAQPFSSAGFEILEKKNFCWIPHSGGCALTTVMKTLTPALNSLVPSRAMRSLVIARKVT
jgi:SAM-dependent methyltransferase